MKIKRDNKHIKNLSLDTLELKPLELYLDDLKLKENRFVLEDEKLIVLDVKDEFSLKVVNKIYPQNNTELEGLYKSGTIFCTQNEPEGFRRITPYIDRPDNMSVFTTTVIAEKEKYPILLSNGNKEEAKDLENGRHSVTWVDPFVKPSYLFALVAGDLGVVNDSFKTASNKDIELNIYCDLGNEAKCSHAMKSLKEAMLWDEQKYGREYDLNIYNIVAVDSFNMGAMENKGLNIFNSHYVLADEDSATDANFMGIQSVIAHEYFHNWTGNRITCRDWFQLTLKEGLTVFRDQSFSADLNSKEVQRIQDVKSLRDRQFVEDASPTAHPIQPISYMSINNFYTATVYEKGAEVIRMIHTLLGEKNYRAATDLYFENFDGQAVTTDDFLWAMSEASGENLSEFKRWYKQARTPKLKVEESYENNTYKLTLSQIIPNSVDGTKQEAYYFPLKIALLDKNGKELKLTCKNQARLDEGILIVSKEKEDFIFETINERPVLSITRDFSAPVIIDFKESDYEFLMKYDSNSFIRYESAQSFAIETLENMIQGKEINQEFVSAYGYLLDLEIELNYKALLLELPNISTLMQRQNKVDFEPLYEAKEKLTKYLAKIIPIIVKINSAKLNTQIKSCPISNIFFLSLR
jgi:aminopeptidase N